MKKVETIYSFNKTEESLTIKVNEEVKDRFKEPLIYIEDYKCWREKQNAIKYYEWLINCIKEIN